MARIIQFRRRLSPKFTIFTVLAVLLAGTLVVTPTTNVKAVTDEWELACSESPSGTYNYLFGVAAQADDAVVTVGSKSVSGTFKPLIERWEPASGNDPACFKEKSTPSVSDQGELFGVARIPTSSLSQVPFWAVGYQGASTSDRTWDSDIGDWIIGGSAQTLIERSTNGGQNWSIVSSPNLTGTNVLKGVAARTDGDAWAVGYYDEGNGERTLTLRWDGTDWEVVASPNQSGAAQNWLYGVSIVSEDDVWAVGFARYASGWPRVKNLILHWNGSSWTEQQNTPQPSSYFNYLFGVTGISDVQAHAVGAYFPDTSAKDTQALKWDPYNSWQYESSPSPGEGANVFYGVAPVTSGYIWAVGSAEDPPHRTLTARRVNGTWYHITSPNANSYINELRAVAVVPGTSPCAGGNNWAVGYYLDGSNVAYTLAMRYQISPSCDLNP